MSNDDITTGGGAGAAGARRSPRQGVGGSPVGSTLSIVLAVVALVVGFLILRDLTNEESAGSSAPITSTPIEDVTTTTFDPNITSTVDTTTTTSEPFRTEGATVVVANANTSGGSAGRMTDELKAVGFDMLSPVNASNTLDASIVYFDPAVAGADLVAQSVARALGGVEVATSVPTPLPVDGASFGDAGVIALLGNDQADKTVAELTEAGGISTPEAGTAPPVAGGDVVAPTEPVADDG